MFRYFDSIRSKITFGYYVIITAIVALLVIALFEIRYVAKEVMFREDVSEFFDTVLEVRRFEKNFFLYGKTSDFNEMMLYTDRAINLLNNNVVQLQNLISTERIQHLLEALMYYKQLQQRYISQLQSHAPESTIDDIERRIRQVGKEIHDTVKEISQNESTYLNRALTSTRDILILSIAFLFITAVALGQVLSKMIVKPLKLLEDSLQAIADGSFNQIYINSKDREIVSLTTAINKMLKELEVRQRHLIHSEKLASLGTLISGIAHEINNPLSNISTSAEILKEEFDEADREYLLELISQIEQQSDRARNIVRSLLDYSRDSSFKKEHVKLLEMVEETLRFIKSHVPTSISIKIEIPEEITIFVDKQRMQQVFLNLIKNACEAIESEGLITIKAYKHSAQQKAEDLSDMNNFLRYRGKCTLQEDTIDIEIADTGIGIAPEIIPKIFDPFFTTKDVGKGSGLGLYIVYEIIEEHDGCIAVSSEPSKGTRFLIRLPVKI